MEIYLSEVRQEAERLGGKFTFAFDADGNVCDRGMFEYRFAIGELIDGKDYTNSHSVATIYVYIRKADNRIIFSDYDRYNQMTLNFNNFNGDENDRYLIRISLMKFLDELYMCRNRRDEHLWCDGMLDENNIYHRYVQMTLVQ